MKREECASNHPIRNDLLLIVGLLLVSAIGLVYLFVFRERGDTVTVTVDGNTYGVYALSQDVVEDIYTGVNGEQHNRLVIRDAKAYMETATCPDGICVAHTPIFRDGESIVCLPNRVVITVTVDHGADSPDIVV